MHSSPSPYGGLSAYGWDDSLELSFADHRSAGREPVRVVAVDRGRCDVVAASGPVRAATGRGLDPCTGDWAALAPGDEPRLTALLPRRTAIVRATAARDSHGQVLAANVDTVVVAVPMTAAPSVGRLERLLALAWESGARPVVALTKSDDGADPVEAVAAAEAAAPGVDVVPTSAVTGAGLPELTALLTGTVALLGPSGAGKSTLGNALLGTERLATGAVRERDGKGRHTTVRRELVPMPGGGVLIDTPGLRGVGLYDAAEGLDQVFPEMERLAADCRFADCAHESEPGCAVLAAVESGELPSRRLASYRKLQRENAWAESRADARLAGERKERYKAGTRDLRAMYRFRDRQR